MKKSFIRFICSIFMCFFLSSSFAFEWGGLFSTQLGFDIGSPNRIDNPTCFNNANKFSMWAKQNIDKDGFYTFATQGSAYLKIRKLIAPEKQKAGLKPILDIDLLKFSFFIPLGKSGSLNIDIGRRGLLDSTGLIMHQSLDGIFFDYKNPHFSMMSSFAFTTLLNANTTVLNEDGYKMRNYFYALPKSYATLIAMFQIPILKTSYSLNLDTLHFFETKKDGKIKMYGTFGVKGPIVRHLFFSASVSGSFVKNAVEKDREVFWNMGLQSTFAMSYYFTKYNAKLGFNMQYAMGGEKNNFQSFTLRHVSSQFFSPYTDIWNTGLSASIKPVPELYIQGLANIICKAHFSKKDKEDARKSLYQGFEWNLRSIYTIKQDISFEASLGQYIKNDNSLQTFVSLKGLISF